MAKVISLKKTINEAASEEENDLSVAIKDYEDVLAKEPLMEKAYNRLMILYRKKKDYKNELRIINAGIKAFSDFYRSKKSGSKKVADLSKKLNRAFGFTDKKGNAVYEPEPLPTWKKRKETVQKKIKK
jgi:hypothetical protein